MSQPETDDIENRPDLNFRKKWSEMALWDLGNCLRLNRPIEDRKLHVPVATRDPRQNRRIGAIG